jgi:lipid-A-disaccharide synthase
MSMTKPPLKIGIIAGEESGDILGADLVIALRKNAGREIELSGVGGPHLAAEGLASLFDPTEIALMGISAILSKLPRLISLIGKTASHILAKKPDCLIVIDSPDFCHRVARKVRAADPSIPIINYVCPSVWAWRPGRAAAMTAYIDHVLAILPFEPKVLEDLKGPPATYVGHRLARDPGIFSAAANQARLESARMPGGTKTLLVLPGSRNSEVKRHAPLFGEALGILKQRGLDFTAIVPVTPNVEANVWRLVQDWPVKPEIVTGSAAKLAAFGCADAALAASGTVTLELALAGVPLISCYRFDPIAKYVSEHYVTSWTASLPNLIADQPVVSEHYNAFIRAPMLARHIEMLINPTLTRAAMLGGFKTIRARMESELAPGEISAAIVLKFATDRRKA